MKWYEMAATQGYAKAQTNLGIMHGNGRGVPQDYTVARQWYEKAAAVGQAEAMANLGLMHGSGWGVPQNDTTAVKWLERAAKHGDAKAQWKPRVLVLHWRWQIWAACTRRDGECRGILSKRGNISSEPWQQNLNLRVRTLRESMH